MRYVKLAEGPFHAYRTAPGKTLCGKTVRAMEHGWAATGCPPDDPMFPLELCDRCKALVLEGSGADA